MEANTPREPIDVKAAARRTAKAGNWIHVETEAFRSAKDMNAEEWEAFLQELNALGLDVMAKALRTTYAKNDQTTVYTRDAAVRRIGEHGDGRLMLNEGVSMMREMNEAQRADVIKRLQETGRGALAQNILYVLNQKAA